MSEILLKVDNLKIEFDTRVGKVKVVDDISFEVHENETFCIIGESGCGKSVVATSIMGMLPSNANMGGQIWYKGKNISKYNEAEFTSLRGKEIAMIFEQPMSCLNPVMPIGVQIAEAFKGNNACSQKYALEQAKHMLEEVGISAERYKQFPHELSGGMQQRVMIAIALACQPKLLIADEPTTSLDVTVQLQILDLLYKLKERYQMSLLMITHDLGVVAEMADTVGVMYAGTMLELSSVNDFFLRPEHPYSSALINIISNNTLNPIHGSVPNLMETIVGCPFYPRCTKAQAVCGRRKPQLKIINNRMERCHFAGINQS